MSGFRKLTTLFAATFSVLWNGPALAQSVRGEFVFSETKIEGFKLEARTFWIADNTPPEIDTINCIGDNGDIRFEINQVGAIEMLNSQFLTDPDTKGRRDHGVYLDDQIWIYADNDRFELRHIGTANGRFHNFPYAKIDEPTEIILVWRGTRSVRRSEAEPFRPFAGYYEEFVDAKKLEWSMKSPDKSGHRGANVTPGKRYRIDNKGLKSAAEWCRRAVASPAARTLPADLLERLIKRE
ncbi:MAG: hypothetical protein JSR96_00255 [Proteobacteria bacterium]|nr:hypothetical protein [Pseudomonadota bacterium]